MRLGQTPGQRRSHVWAIALSVSVLLGGCSSTENDLTNSTLDIIATTTMLGDVTANVAGDAAPVTVLLPIGADPHGYQVSARQVAAMLAADVIISNGLHLEQGIQAVIDQAEADGVTVLEVGPLLDPLPRALSSLEDPAEGDLDPHVWLDPVRMARAATAIAGILEVEAPGEGWSERADAYGAELLAADQSISDLLAEIPAERRKLVTNHDSLGYFAARYDLEVIGFVVPGGSTLAKPSSQDLAELVATVDAAGVSAIFAETTEPLDLAKAVAAEASRPISVYTLYTGSLGGPGSGAETLIDMLVSDARTIAEALQ